MRRCSRRDFLLGGASALALLKSSPAAAWTHGGSGFNGGRSQGQSTVPGISGDWPFINLIKMVGSWSSNGTGTGGTLPSSQELPPNWADANGYPSESLAGANDWNIFLGVPLSTSKQATALSPFVLTWEGNTTIQFPFVTITSRSGGSGSTISPAFDIPSGLWKGRCEWYPSYQTDPRSGTVGSAVITGITIPIGGITAGSYIDKLSLYFKDYEPQFLAGQIFSPQFVSQLRAANFGVYRFMDWIATNVSNVTTWATRKSLNYFTWSDYEYRAALYAGITTNSGNDYSLSIAGGYSWVNPIQGNYAGGAPVDKMTMHIGFNADATFVENNEHSTLTVTAFSPVTFGWTAHPLVNGDPVGLDSIPGVGGNFMTGFSPGKNYYVVNKTANSFQLALTPGGTALSSTDTSSFGNNQIVRMPTLNIGTGGAVPIRQKSTWPLNAASLLPAGGSFTATIKRFFWATLTYDADLNAWLMWGGSTNQFSNGLQNDVPIEVCFSLCKQLGMHPYFSIPALPMDPMTDYSKSLMQYCQSNNPGWMIPRFEPGNEVWNNLTPITLYAQAKAFAHWGGSNGNQNAWQGKVMSTLGQDAATVFGIGNLKTKYKTLCGGQYVGTDPAGYPNDRIQSTTYVAQAASPQSGYLKTAALPYVSTMMSADYIYPSYYRTSNELQLAWQWSVTNAGNSAAQTANLNSYVDTMPAAGDPNVPGSLTSYYLGTANWGLSQSPPVTEMNGYEGGYSPDLVAIAPTVFAQQWFSLISAATRANPCILTLPTYGNAEGGSGSGNPAQVGMILSVANVTTMTQLNTQNSVTCSFTSGSSVITATNSFIAGQGIMFQDLLSGGRPLPPGISANKPYYIIAAGLSGSQFSIALTKGGTAIVADPTGIFTGTWPNNVGDVGWFVTAVSGSNVTIDVDSSAFTAFSGSNGGAVYLGSTSIVNNFRLAGLYAPDLQTYTTINYQNFALVGGSFPSQYEFSGTGSEWPIIQPDIWGPQSKAFAAIAAYNH